MQLTWSQVFSQVILGHSYTWLRGQCLAGRQWNRVTVDENDLVCLCQSSVPFFFLFLIFYADCTVGIPLFACQTDAAYLSPQPPLSIQQRSVCSPCLAPVWIIDAHEKYRTESASSGDSDGVPTASEFFLESRAACSRIVDAAPSSSPAAGPLIAGV